MIVVCLLSIILFFLTAFLYRINVIRGVFSSKQAYDMATWAILSIFWPLAVILLLVGCLAFAMLIAVDFWMLLAGDEKG